MSPLRHARPGDPTPLAATAASWALRSEQGLTERDQRRLEAWLEEPTHRIAFDEAIWALDIVQAHAASPELLELREAALTKRGRTRYWHAVGGTALATVAALGLVLAVPFGRQLLEPVAQSERRPVEAASATAAPPRDGVYKTGVGERSAIVLPDGSIATLDTDSQLIVAYSTASRSLVLKRGQAFFDVAKGRARPFVVLAAGQRIKAIGTKFNVRIDRASVEVAMVEGTVEVSDRTPGNDAPVRALLLRAGEKLSSGPEESVHVRPTEGDVAAWRGGVLVFEDERLDAAIAEVNRYASTPIRIGDPTIGAYRVTGVFKTNNPERFASAMTEVFPVEMERRADGAPVLTAKR